MIALTALVFAAGGYGVSQAIHSPLFLVQVIEVSGVENSVDVLGSEGPPLDAAAITALAQVPVGQVNLFDLDLKPIERRLLTNSWIKEVKLQKVFPQTLAIDVEFRNPRALIQADDGNLAYVDKDGQVFGHASLMYRADLPIFHGPPGEEGQIPQAVKVLTSLERSLPSEQVQVASLEWDRENGFRALVTYPVEKLRLNRTWVDFGQEPEALDPASGINRLSQVFHYLSQHSIAARQIWADAGKKIVVKTARGS